MQKPVQIQYNNNKTNEYSCSNVILINFNILLFIGYLAMIISGYKKQQQKTIEIGTHCVKTSSNSVK